MNHFCKWPTNSLPDYHVINKSITKDSRLSSKQKKKKKKTQKGWSVKEDVACITVVFMVKIHFINNKPEYSACRCRAIYAIYIIPPFTLDSGPYWEPMRPLDRLLQRCMEHTDGAGKPPNCPSLDDWVRCMRSRKLGQMTRVDFNAPVQGGGQKALWSASSLLLRHAATYHRERHFRAEKVSQAACSGASDHSTAAVVQEAEAPEQLPAVLRGRARRFRLQALLKIALAMQ